MPTPAADGPSRAALAQRAQQISQARRASAAEARDVRQATVEPPANLTLFDEVDEASVESFPASDHPPGDETKAD